MYASTDFATREELFLAVQGGKIVGLKPRNVEEVPMFGVIDIEGPWHYRFDPLWTARVIVKGGKIVNVSRHDVREGY